MANNEIAVIKKPGILAIIFNTPKWQKYEASIAQREDAVAVREDEVAVKENAVAVRENKVSDDEKNLTTLRNKLAQIQKNLAQREEEAKVVSEGQENYSGYLQELKDALVNWQKTLQEYSKRSIGEQEQLILALQDALQVKDATLEGAENKLAATLEALRNANEIIENLQEQNRTLKGNVEAARKQASRAENRAAEANLTAEEAKKRLERFKEQKRKKGKINEHKDDVALELEIEYKEYLNKIGEEYNQEINDTDTYFINDGSKQQRYKEARGKLIAKALGALAAYTDMDPNQELSADIMGEIMRVARTECGKYAESDMGTYDHTKFKVHDVDRFYTLFLEGFAERRYEGFESLSDRNKKSIINMLKEMNYGERHFDSKYKEGIFRNKTVREQYPTKVPFSFSRIKSLPDKYRKDLYQYEQNKFDYLETFMI